MSDIKTHTIDTDANADSANANDATTDNATANADADAVRRPNRHQRLRAMGRSWRSEGGQATAEYGLVILAAAALAGVLLVWATSNGGINRLMDAVMDSIIAGVTGP